MNHPIIIGPLGKTCRAKGSSFARGVARTIRRISKWDLVPQKIYMNQADYNDIVKWSKGNE